MIYIRSDNIRIQGGKYDAETGEPDTDRVLLDYMKEEHFHIPRVFLEVEKEGHECPIFGGVWPRLLNEAVNHVDNQRKDNDKDMDVDKDNDLNTTTYNRLDTNSKPKPNTFYKKDDFINMEGVSKASDRDSYP